MKERLEAGETGAECRERMVMQGGVGVKIFP